MTPIETLYELARIQNKIVEAEDRKSELEQNAWFGDAVPADEFFGLNNTISASTQKMQELLKPYYETDSKRST